MNDELMKPIELIACDIIDAAIERETDAECRNDLLLIQVNFDQINAMIRDSNNEKNKK